MISVILCYFLIFLRVFVLFLNQNKKIIVKNRKKNRKLFLVDLNVWK